MRGAHCSLLPKIGAPATPAVWQVAHFDLYKSSVSPALNCDEPATNNEAIAILSIFFIFIIS